MFVVKRSSGSPKPEQYRQLNQQISALLAGETDGLANCANLASLLFEALPELNWAGFYFMRAGELVLGPFQGKVACVRIALDRGVCGTAARERRVVIVPDVHAFAGHIACDTASRSEIVLPLLSQDVLLGVLDLDSPVVARFDQEDADGLAVAVRILLAGSDMTRVYDPLV